MSRPVVYEEKIAAIDPDHNLLPIMIQVLGPDPDSHGSRRARALSKELLVEIRVTVDVGIDPPLKVIRRVRSGDLARVHGRGITRAAKETHR